MKTLTKNEWDSIIEGRLEKSKTIDEFKKEYEISDEEFYKAQTTNSKQNEYGNVDVTFSDEEGDSITIELDENENVTHIYKN